jgi:hypothetical protein
MNVIDLTTAVGLLPKRRDGHCRCQQVRVIEQTRMLECQKCARVIDPFDFVWQQAQKQHRSVFNIQCSRDEVNRLQAEVEDLKRQKRNLKSCINRAQKEQRANPVLAQTLAKLEELEKDDGQA